MTKMPRLPLALGLLFAYLVVSGLPVEDLGLNREQLEGKLLDLVNHERSGRGLPELQFDPRLRDLARAHSQKMIKENRLSHDFPGYEPLAARAVKAGLYFSHIGENVARGDTFVMRLFHEQLLASSGHRANILSKNYAQLGVGIECHGNVYYVTQVFANLVQPLAPLAMEAALEKKLHIRFGSAIALAQASDAEIREFCRRMSAAALQNQFPKTATTPYGSASILNVNFLDMETGFARVCAETTAGKPLFWSLGVAFGRTADNPGGIYSLSLIRFPDLRDIPTAADGLAAMVLESVNQIRKKNARLNMVLIPKLSKVATEVARLYYQSPDNLDSIRDKDRYKLIFAYQTASLADVPGAISQKIVSDPRIVSIGIHVFYPLAEGLLGNYFIVAILGI